MKISWKYFLLGILGTIVLSMVPWLLSRSNVQVTQCSGLDCVDNDKFDAGTYVLMCEPDAGVDSLDCE